MRLIFLSLIFIAQSAVAISFSTYKQKPKLVVVFVIDQFRADFLARFQKDFEPIGKMGFNFLMNDGAYFPQSRYDILQAMTCPGHAMILTGSYPAQTSIQLNEWYDSANRKKAYCADDAEYGLSPRRLKTTTFGDEVKNIYPDSKVFTVAVKDRSAIFLGGHRADMAFWYDDKSKQWETSKYYQGGKLPEWFKKINEKQKQQDNLEGRNFASAELGTKATLDVALAILENEKLGSANSRGPDVLGVSLSNHDILGHIEGVDSPNMKKLTLLEDRMVSELFAKLKKLNLLDKTAVVLTADHGIPPVIETMQQNKLSAGKMDYLQVIKEANKKLEDEFGSSGDRPWVEGIHASHIYLNRERIAAKKIDTAKIQNAAKTVFEKLAGVYKVITREEILRAQIPYFDLRWPVENSFVPDVSGDLILVLEPFYIEKGSSLVNHMTNWSYDTTVPLIIWGPKWFKSGVYAGSKIVDIAPTLSFVFGVLPPAKSSGRVLNEAL